MEATKRSSDEATKGRKARRGFTLTEILIVIALIVLVIALAIPAFSFITGSRSVDAGENLVSAMMGRARAEAIRNQRVAGVAFFREKSTDRATMALVVPASLRGAQSPEAAGLEQYKGWKQYQEPPDLTNPTASPVVRYYVGDVVIALVDVPGPQGGNKRVTKQYVCIEEHDADPQRYPPDPSDPPSAMGWDYWGTVNDTDIDSLVGFDYQYLPTGIGAQTINDPDPDPIINAAPSYGRDRYLGNGLILFGPDGQLLHRQYIITAPANTDPDTTHLYRLMNFDDRKITPAQNNVDVGAVPAHPHYSQLGVVLYEEEQFKNAGGNIDDPLNDNQQYNTAGYNEQAEESWLDQNCLSLMINRYNGTLVRGE